MDWLIAIIVATAVWIIQPLWELPISYLLERIFTRSPLHLGKQLRGLTFAILAAPISAVTLLGGQNLMAATHVAPLIDLKRFAWAAEHHGWAITAAVVVSLLGFDLL